MISRSKIFVSILISALIAFMPFTFCVSEYNRSINFDLNSAYAADGTDYDFLSEMATASGLSIDDFIATVANCTTIGIGLNIANSLGIDYGKSNLDSLVSAADFPEWDTLTEEQQDSWGSVDNYYSAKFNSLMHAFGMAEADERFTGSGGSSGFTFTEREQDILNRLGSIGNNWKNRVGNTFQDVANTITNQNAALLWSNNANFNYTPSENDTNWPSQVTGSVSLGRGTQLKVNADRTYYYVSDSDVYYWAFWLSTSSFNVVQFEDYSFKYNSGFRVVPSPTNTAATKTVNGNTFYESWIGRGVDSFSSANMPINGNYGSLTREQIDTVCDYILHGNLDKQPNVEDYPEEIEPSQETYFPDDGLTPETTWNILITAPEGGGSGSVDLSQIIALLNRFNFTSSGDLRVHDSEILTAIENCCNRFQFYTTGQLKVHDEGVFDSLTDIGTILEQIKGLLQAWPKGDAPDAPDIIGEVDFDELNNKSVDLVDTISSLAPFGSLLLLSEVYAIVSAGGVIDEPTLEFNFDFFFGHHNVVVVDLSWLADLKPVINFFMILMLIVLLTQISIRVVEMEAAG